MDNENPEHVSESAPESERPSKLAIDRPQDFKFHVAYDAYSRAWDGNPSEAIRQKLNEVISDLSKNDTEDGYHAFYNAIQQYRKDLTSFRSPRTRIETQRKREWQRTSARDTRNRRHR